MSGVVRLQFSSLELLSLCFCLLSAGRTRGDQHGVVRVFAAEGSDVILPCSLSTKENIQSQLFDWGKDGPRDDREVFLYDAGIHYNNGRSGQSETFKGRVSHFPDQLKYGNASITIRNTKMTDSGNYTCHFPRLQPRQKFYVELVVEPILKDRSCENPAATPKPSVTILDATETLILLQCDVQGASLKPKVQWQDSDGNILPAEEPQVSERGGSYDIILKTTVTKNARYRCVATQETISHQVSAEIFVHISEKHSPSIIGPLFGGLFLGAVIVAAVLALLVATKVITIRCYKDVVRVFAAEGSDVILPCSLSTKENIQLEIFDWKKDGQKDEYRKNVFLYYKGDQYNNGLSGQSETFTDRVSHFPDQLKYGNASITITNTKMTDSGNYTCYFPLLQPRQKFYVELVVGVVRVFATEGSDVILPCSLSTKENIQSEIFDWKKDGQKDEYRKNVFLYEAGDQYNNRLSGQSKQFKGRVSHFPDQLEYGIASIIIRNTKMTDSGNYTCYFPRLQPPQIFRVELFVGSREQTEFSCEEIPLRESESECERERVSESESESESKSE